ncbi:MAG: glycosyltransferase family 39 protein [Kastovskya adunca ATA6-11-RM4]|nr:glycosyltransferase family 39 protein [Kastovskya adunca ATA6-11-RM4]
MLTGVVVVAAILRFWHLDFKALWLDEIITALLTLGHSYEDVPLDLLLPLSSFTQQLFTEPVAASCPDIAQTLASQSTHPPLFFCLMHQWLRWLNPLELSLAWKLRSLPALFGVAAVLAVYFLNRVAFSPRAGLLGAVLMAVSPFGIYLSQEARHYTLAILAIALALVALIKIQQNLYSRQPPQIGVWLFWVIANSIGWYIHYFAILATVAQVFTLIVLMYQRQFLARYSWLAFSVAVLAIALLYLPWFPVMFNHFASPGASWLPPPQHIVPLFQALAAGVLMVIALPVEGQSLAIALPMIVLMFGFAGWIAFTSWRGIKQLWQHPKTQPPTFTLLCFTLCVVGEFLVIIYLLGKDLTVAPRYHFVYYPAVCALLGASLGEAGRYSPQRAQGEPKLPLARLTNRVLVDTNRSYDRVSPSPHPVVSVTTSSQNGSVVSSKLFLPRPLLAAWYNSRRLTLDSHKTILLLIFVGILSWVFIISNLAFQKTYLPDKLAQNFNLESTTPVVVVVEYIDSQDVAMGLSFAFALDQLRTTAENQGNSKNNAAAYFSFSDKQSRYQLLQPPLSQPSVLPPPPFNLWIVAPKMARQYYVPEIAIAPSTLCTLDPIHHHPEGISHQLYRCQRP